MATLRPYQSEAVDAICRRLLLDDSQRQLMVLPTASGKTVIFSELPAYFGRTLILAHRKELIRQAATKVVSSNQSLCVAVEMADERARADADVIVASVQTLASEKRRGKLKQRPFDLVIVDEAHHCSEGNSYETILRDLGCFDLGGPKLLGVTATPFRTGGESLAHFFEGVCYEKPLLQMIDEGWVSPLAVYAVYTKTTLDGVGTKGGDFKEGELSYAVNTETRNLEIVRAWEKLAADRRSTLVFAVDVSHANALAVAFTASGHAAEVVLGSTPDAERAAMFGRFLRRDLPVLVNVGVATEGTDLPCIDCIVQARPTKSSLLITQMCGRGLRLYEGKKDCLIIDLVDNSSRHHLATSATVLGLPANANAKGKDLRTIKTRLEEFCKDYPGIDISGPKEITLEWIENQRLRIQALMERSSTEVTALPVHLLGAADPQIKKLSGLTWIRAYDGSVRLRIPPRTKDDPGAWVEVRRDASDHYRVTVTDGKTPAQFGETFPTREAAIKDADAMVRSLFADRLKMIDSGASWMQQAASDEQRSLIRKLGGTDRPNMTKGDAKRLIDALQTMRDAKNQGPCTSRQAWRLRQMGMDPRRISFRQAREIIASSQAR